ncbi:Innexin-10 [Bulinus truncatus]|nr:Innexin-10 [Bulinus truncatus]
MGQFMRLLQLEGGEGVESSTLTLIKLNYHINYESICDYFATILWARLHHRRVPCLLLQSSNDDDAVDRLGYHTAPLLVDAHVCIADKQYVDNAIGVSAVPPSSLLQDYTGPTAGSRTPTRWTSANRCPRTVRPEKRRDSYYQWSGQNMAVGVPSLLLVMAAMFKLPNLLWRVFSYNSGMDLNQVASQSSTVRWAPRRRPRRQYNKWPSTLTDGWRATGRLAWNAVVRTKKYAPRDPVLFCEGSNMTSQTDGHHRETEDKHDIIEKTQQQADILD